MCDVHRLILPEAIIVFNSGLLLIAHKYFVPYFDTLNVQMNWDIIVNNILE